MAHLLRLIAHGALAVLACWLMLQPLAAHAAFPATFQQGWQVLNGTTLWTGTATGPADVCAQAGMTWNSGGYCMPGYRVPAQNNAYNVYSCPANSTLAGTECSCNAGFTQSGSSCIDPLAEACAALTNQVVFVSIPGEQTVGAAVCGSTGCSMTLGSPVIRARTQAGTWVTEGEARFTGGTCNPSAPATPVAADDPCPDGQPGQVNGQDVCIPYSPTDEVVRDTGSTTETTEGGNTTQTSTSTSTTCTGGSCNTTTTTTTVVNGGTPTVTTSETTEPRDDYCTRNPRSPQCQQSAFGGSCASGFTCQGDAVQCATARELHAISCGLQATSDEATLYGAEKNPAGGPADIPSDTVSVGPGDLDASNALGVAACVADLPLTVAGTSVTLPLSDICPYLEYLRLMLLAVAWLMAFRIVSGG